MRSFLATVRSNRKFVTHNHDQFNTFKTKDKFTPHAPFNLTNKKDKIPEKPLTIEELRRRWNLDDLKKYEIKAPTSSEQISNREEIQRRKEELSRGSKGLINGIYNSSTLTNYQECYK